MTYFYHDHPGSGLPTPDWCECALCSHPLQLDRGRELADPDWQYLDLQTSDREPVCAECRDELDLVGGDVVLVNEWAEVRATA